MTQLLWMRSQALTMTGDVALNDEMFNLSRYLCVRLTHFQRFTLLDLQGVFPD